MHPFRFLFPGVRLLYFKRFCQFICLLPKVTSFGQHLAINFWNKAVPSQLVCAKLLSCCVELLYTRSGVPWSAHQPGASGAGAVRSRCLHCGLCVLPILILHHSLSFFYIFILTRSSTVCGPSLPAGSVLMNPYGGDGQRNFTMSHEVVHLICNRY